MPNTGATVLLDAQPKVARQRVVGQDDMRAGLTHVGASALRLPARRNAMASTSAQTSVAPHDCAAAAPIAP